MNQAQDAVAVNANAAQQIQALEQEKGSRTAEQQKIDSNVLYTVRMLQGQAAAPGISFLHTGVELDQNDNLVVDITANVTDQLLRQLTNAGALVLYSSAQYHSIRAIVPPNQMETIAASPDVSFISPKQESITEGAPNLPRSHGLPKYLLAPSFAQRAERVRAQLSAMLAMPNVIINTGQGSVTTEGDATHRAFEARGTFGVNGAGLKIGVLSDSVNNRNSATQAQASGDLPPTCGNNVPLPCLTVLQDKPSGGSDEGTAMLEIIYDMAPGASLYFATADISEASFATNIQALRTAGCDIIVDDIFYFDESPFQDGIVAQAVNTVATSGALYFSSAGNEGNVDSSTAGYFEGDFNSNGSPAFTFPGGAKTGTIHNFGTVANPVNGDIITTVGKAYILNWADPAGASTNDYDLFLLDSSGNVKASSTNIQNGTQNPYELIAPPALVAGDRLVVFKSTAAANRFFAINTMRGTLTVVTAGQTHGHSAVTGAGVYSVAATPAAEAFSSSSPTGPFPNPFSTSNQVELFTSDGPRRIFFNADGTVAGAAGNFSSTGGVVRQKPDITAADGVSTTLPLGSGLNPFFGTSAAAPSAAAVAALVKSANPALTQTQIRSALTSTALDIMGAGVDRDSGVGIVMAWEAVHSLGITGSANPELGTITASENPGNGNGIIEAGEGAKLIIQLKNTSGVVDATGITATLTTATPGVTITQPNTAAYANLTAGSGTGNNLSPFTFTLASNTPPGLVVNFTLTVSYTGGPQRVLSFSVPTGMVTFNDTLGTQPTGTTGITTATGTQTDRVYRNGVPSVCGTAKPNPGILTAGTRTFNSYTFTATQSACMNVTLTSASAANLFEVAYSPVFVPANVSTNYAADPGVSANGQTFGLAVVAGTSYVVVVSDSSRSGTAAGTSYSLQIPSGIYTPLANVNHPPIALAHNVTVMASPNGTANANIDDGSSDPDAGDTITLTQTPPSPYSVGNTTVLLTVVDSKGATAQATATVTVVAPPTIAKAFGATSIALNGSTSLTFTIANATANTVQLTGVAFTDTLPAGLVVATPNGLTTTCNGTTTAIAGSGTVSLSSATLAASGSCTVGVNVTGTTTGVKNNSVTITSTEGGTGIVSNASVEVGMQPPTIAKAFGTGTIALNGTTSLTFTLTNPAANTIPLTGVAFTDTFPAGVVIATPNGLTNTCNGTPTATAGSGSVSLTGGTIAANGTCTLVVNIAGTANGSVTNTTGHVSSAEGGTGSTASANLTIATPDFTVPATLTAITVKAGQSGTTHMAFAPNPVTASSTTFTCSAGLPALANCSFAPSSEPAGTTSADVVLTISTTAASAMLQEQHPRVFYAAWLPFTGLGLMGIVFAGTFRKNRKATVIFTASSLLLILSILIGCGGGSSKPGTPLGTSTVTVTATSGSVTHTSTVSLTVN